MYKHFFQAGAGLLHIAHCTDMYFTDTVGGDGMAALRQ